VCKGLLNKSGTLWQFFNAKKQLLQDKIDVFWATENIFSCNLSGTKIKKVLTMYDLMWLEYLHTFDFINFCVYGLFGKKSYNNADYILTVSNASRKKIESVFGQTKPIEVIHNGIDEAFKPLVKLECQEYCKTKFKISKDYMLCVSVLKPTKNIAGLLRAFKVFKDKYKTNLQLVIVGSKGWGYKHIERTYNELEFSKGEVVFLGYVEKDDLPKLYSGARIFILLSLDEGFGFPVLEAMACGTPVICSDIPALREVGEDAVEYVCPTDPQAVAQAIHKVNTNGVEMQTRIEKGLRQSSKFSWEKSASEILDFMGKGE
jgi:glycosyltransferase involved in cell wall biosynthesis